MRLELSVSRVKVRRGVVRAVHRDNDAVKAEIRGMPTGQWRRYEHTFDDGETTAMRFPNCSRE